MASANLIEEGEEIMKNKTSNRQLRALQLAKILFQDQGYHTKYLREIEQVIKENNGGEYDNQNNQSSQQV